MAARTRRHRTQADAKNAGIVLINPNNPTGSLCSRQMLEQVADLARRHNLVVFATKSTTN